MKTCAPAWSVSLALAVTCVAAAAPPARAQEVPLRRPFETLLPWTLERGRWEAGAGLLYRENAAPPFFSELPETRRTEWRASLPDFRVGLGSGGEARVEFGAQRFSEQGGEKETGIQDARLSFSYKLPVRRIDAAARLAVKLPNASNERRLGTDETDLFLTGAAGRARERWGWAAELGLGILGSPRDVAAQDDVIIMGAAVWLSPGAAGAPARVALLGELHGMGGSRFGNNPRYARAGVRLFRRLPVDITLRRGLGTDSERWGIEAGVTMRSSEPSHPIGR